MIKNIEALQPHIVVNLGESVHVMPVSLVRDIANGRIEATEEQARCLAVALMDYINMSEEA